MHDSTVCLKSDCFGTPVPIRKLVSAELEYFLDEKRKDKNASYYALCPNCHAHVSDTTVEKTVSRWKKSQQAEFTVLSNQVESALQYG